MGATIHTLPVPTMVIERNDINASVEWCKRQEAKLALQILRLETRRAILRHRLELLRSLRSSV